MWAACSYYLLMSGPADVLTIAKSPPSGGAKRGMSSHWIVLNETKAPTTPGLFWQGPTFVIYLFVSNGVHQQGLTVSGLIAII